MRKRLLLIFFTNKGIQQLVCLFTQFNPDVSAAKIVPKSKEHRHCFQCPVRLLCNSASLRYQSAGSNDLAVIIYHKMIHTLGYVAPG